MTGKEDGERRLGTPADVNHSRAILHKELYNSKLPPEYFTRPYTQTGEDPLLGPRTLGPLPLQVGSK